MADRPILHLLGLAKKAGRLEVGEEPVGAACRARQARLVLVAADAAANTCRRAAHFGELGGVLWLQVPCTKQELGFQLGRSSCAMLAITDAGFAAAVCDKLQAQDPERYAAAAQQLRGKADKVLQRQREQRQHEKNLRQGKKKPWDRPSAKRDDPARDQKEKAARPPHRGGDAGRGEGSPAQGRQVRKPGPAGRRLTGKFRREG